MARIADLAIAIGIGLAAAGIGARSGRLADLVRETCSVGAAMAAANSVRPSAGPQWFLQEAKIEMAKPVLGGLPRS